MFVRMSGMLMLVSRSHHRRHSIRRLDERPVFGNKTRRKQHGPHRKFFAVLGDHSLGDFGKLHEERVLRLLFSGQFWRLGSKP